MAGPAVGVVTGALRAYQRWISPMRAPACRFTPTCSQYAVTALERFGVFRGGWLALRRLSRCHPYHRGGHDPVPEVVGRSTATTAAVANRSDGSPSAVRTADSGSGW